MKIFRVVFIRAVRKRQRFAVNGDRYIIFGWTVWPHRTFCQRSLSSVNAIEVVLHTQSRDSCNRKTEPRGRRYDKTMKDQWPRPLPGDFAASIATIATSNANAYFLDTDQGGGGFLGVSGPPPIKLSSARRVARQHR